MILILITLLLFYVYVLFRTSKSTYFYNGNEKLKKDFELLIAICRSYEFTTDELYLVTNAFDYFAIQPFKFAGATIVADNYTIQNLSVTAMIHDYQTIQIGKVNLINYIKARWQTDLQYFKLLQKVKRKWVVNTIINLFILFLLTISTPIYYFIKK